MEAKPETTTTNATDAQNKTATAERLNEFTGQLNETFEKAQKQITDTVARLREEAANVDFDQARVRARSWVEENPTLSVAIAVGAGLLVGKALGSALTPEPPTLKKRALKQAQRVQRYAVDLGGDLAHRAALAGGALAAGGAAAASAASHKAQQVGHVVTERAADVGGRVATYTDGVLDTMQDATKDTRKQLKKKTKKARKSAEHGIDFAGALVDTARTAVAAVVVKKITDWTRKLT